MRIVAHALLFAAERASDCPIFVLEGIGGKDSDAHAWKPHTNRGDAWVTYRNEQYCATGMRPNENSA
jgi:hypothetical protein